MASPGMTYFSPTGDAFIDALTTGYGWSLNADRTVDWSISNGWAGEYWNNPNQLQQDLGAMFALVSYYANIRFNYVGHYNHPGWAYANGSEINVSLDGNGTFFPNSAWAVGHFPTGSSNQLYNGQAGDIYLNIRSQANFLPGYSMGTAGWALFLHEIGHTLGLKHPHNFLNGRPTLSALGFSEFDIDWATLMSYEDDFQWNLLGWEPATPMILDVLALQAMYGMNLTTNLGNTTFKVDLLNSYMTVWDAGGFDVVDASAAATGTYIQLPTYQFSSYLPINIGYVQRLDERSTLNLTTLIWLEGDIEVAVGSARDDVLLGNLLNNNFAGNGGSDYIDGAAGVDYAFYSGPRVGYSTGLTSNGFRVSGEGIDYLMGVERLVFSDRSIAIDLSGNAGKTVKMLGAFLGPWAVQDPYLVGLGLSFFDSGYSNEQVVDFALDAILGQMRSKDTLFNMLYYNAVGTFPNQATTNQFAFSMSETEMVLFTADMTSNLTRIGFTGLQQDGVGYL